MSATSTRGGPLVGVRVIDAGNRIAAPFCAGLLGEQGAEVIKIEQPGTGEFLRDLSPMLNGYSMMWSVEGRSRLERATLDLHHELGQALFRRLCATADVLCENFRPGTMERWHVGPTDLSERLVYVRISTFGQTGPDRLRPGADLIGIANGGLLELTGEPDEAPVKSAVTISDHLTGAIAANAATIALFARDVGGDGHGDGRGRVIDASLCGSVIATLGWRLPALSLGLGHVTRSGNACPLGTFAAVVAGRDERWLAVSAATDDQRAALKSLVGGPPDDVDASLRRWAAVRPAGDCVDALRAIGVGTALVRRPDEIVGDARAWDRGELQTVDDPVIGPVVHPGVQPRIRGFDQRASAAPAIGEHNEYVWRDLAGLTDGELDEARSLGVI